MRGCKYHLGAAFCQALLVDVRDKLLFEQDYAGSIKEKVPPRSSLHIPWSWLPAALCRGGGRGGRAGAWPPL